MTGFNRQEPGKPSQQDLISTFFLVLIILLGSFIRMVHVLYQDFPLNDGGFFYQAIIDLQRAKYSLPVFTTYNLNHIPFAYPPLGFYLGAFLSELFNWPVLAVIRLLPAVISLLTVPAFYLLALRILPTKTQVLFATLGFAFLPTSFDWLIVGGGLTRSLGFLFAILTLWQVHALYTTGLKRHLLLSTLFASLTILSHPGTAWFACFSSLVILVFYGWDRKGWFHKSAAVALGVTLLTAPWWAVVASRHGGAVLMAPFQTESLTLAAVLTPFSFLFTNEPLLDILAFCGLVGVLVSLRDRSYFAPAWLVSVFLFESRLGATYAVIPVSLLIGVGIDLGLRPILDPDPETRTGKGIPWVAKAALGFLVVYAIINAYLGIDYQVVTPEQRAAMEWIESNTPADSRFLVLTGTPEYGTDRVSEWFPSLSQRTSLTTPQAHEWLPDREFTRRIALHAALQACAVQDLSCIERWAAQEELRFSHIYIPDPSPFFFAPDSTAGYEILYAGPGGWVLQKK